MFKKLLIVLVASIFLLSALASIEAYAHEKPYKFGNPFKLIWETLFDHEERITNLEETTSAELNGNAIQIFSGTTPTTWTDLDLSDIVGENYALVYLKVYSDSSLFDHMWRQNGDEGNYNFGLGGPNEARVDAGGDSSYVIVPTDANGIVEWRADRVIHDAHVDVVLFIRQ